MTVAEKPQTLSALKPYRAYKDSGVEWIGEIPENWEVRRLKELTSQKLTNGVGEPGEHDNPLWARYIRITDILNDRALKADTFRSLPPEIAQQADVQRGDILMAAVGASYGKSYLHLEEGNFCYAGFLVRYRPDLDEVVPRYMGYWTQSGGYWHQLRSQVIQATIQNFSASKYAELLVPTPSRAEQDTIAAFLDHETARIDALVREQELLLEDLAEKRQSTITSAVTAGIRPRIAQATDVPWMPLIPQSWRIVRLKHALHGIEQGWSPEGEAREATEDEWAVLKSGCVNRGVFRPEEHKALTADLAPRPELEVKEGDLVMSRASGSLDLIGSVALVGPVRPRLMLSDKLFRLLPRLAEVRPRFLYYAMNSAYMRMQIRLAVSGAEGLANNIGKGSINNFLLFLPPLDDQDNIIAHLDQRVAQIDELVLEVRANIEDMKLLRSALITAATTGKIDVRDWRPA